MTAHSRYFQVAILLVLALTNAPAQTFTTIANFLAADGSNPAAPLVQGTDGNLYGTTLYGGAHGNGTVFKITLQGQISTLYSFQGYPVDGASPGGLVLGSDGNFYGLTTYGGSARCNDGYGYGCGTIFSITPQGDLRTLANFHLASSADSGGINPTGQLVQGRDGNFYGTTYAGGTIEAGTVFRVTPAGLIMTVHNFCSQPKCLDGLDPAAGLVLGNDGDFYGTTAHGGTNAGGYDGTIFKVTPLGEFTTLHDFDGYDGFFPLSPLIKGNDGNFYGTTAEGGLNLFSDGTVFRVTPDGRFDLLVSFSSSYLPPYVYGFHPYAGLVQGTDEFLYGVNFEGGGFSGCYDPARCGTVFSVTPGRRPTLLYDFGVDAGAGANPDAPPLQATNGNFYGTTEYGGA